PGAIVSHEQKKEETLQEHLHQKQMEQQTLEAYMSGNEIRLADLPVIETHVRKMLLGSIGKAMARQDHTFKTEHGRQVQVIVNKKERIILHADDGDLEMPAVTFRFLDEVAG